MHQQMAGVAAAQRVSPNPLQGDLARRPQLQRLIHLPMRSKNPYLLIECFRIGMIQVGGTNLETVTAVKSVPCGCFPRDRSFGCLSGIRAPAQRSDQGVPDNLAASSS